MLALAYAVNLAVPGAGTDHDRDNSSTFSMHRVLSSGGNGAAAAAAAAVVTQAKINRSTGGSSSGGGHSSGQQKRAGEFAGVSGVGRGQADYQPSTRSGGGPGSTAKIRRINE